MKLTFLIQYMENLNDSISKQEEISSYEKENELMSEIGQDNLYIVEKIINRKKEKGVEKFLVKWKGYESKFNTWEPIDNLIGDGCKTLINQFLIRESKKKSKKLKKNKSSRNFNTYKSNNKRQRNKSTSNLKNSTEFSVNNTASKESFLKDSVKEDQSDHKRSSSSKKFNNTTRKYLEKEILRNLMKKEEEDNKSLIKKEEVEEDPDALYLKQKFSVPDSLPITILSVARKENKLIYNITFPVSKEEGIVLHPTEVVPSELLRIMSPDTLIDFLEASIILKE